MQATSCEDIKTLFMTGSTLWFDPADFTSDLVEACKVLFIENQKDQQPQSKFSQLILGEKLIRNEKAIQFEDQQYGYKEKVKLMFKPVVEENKRCLGLIHGQQFTKAILDSNLMQRFKQFCGKEEDIFQAETIA